MNINNFNCQILKNKFFKDSFWAVFGNGCGYGLILLSGIIIAKILGKELYGEYGLVKTTLFYMASFATFGIGLTSTKYLADFINNKKDHVKIIANCCLRITFIFSSIMSLIIIIFADILANFIDSPQLSSPLRFLGILIVFKALSTTQAGIFAGMKQFKINAQNNIISGLCLVAICIPLTKYFSIYGALTGLLISQIFIYVINTYKLSILLSNDLDSQYVKTNYYKHIIKFSFPVALQESSIWIFNWISILMLTKFSNVGELGIYTAAAQWNSIILFVPSLLSNVVLSYISGNSESHNSHYQIFKLSLATNIVCTLVPFLFVVSLSDIISEMYGDTFVGLNYVLNIIVFATIFESCSYVFKSEFISTGKTWLYFGIRIFRDLFMVIMALYLLNKNNGVNGAESLSISIAVSSALFFIVLYITYKKIKIK